MSKYDDYVIEHNGMYYVAYWDSKSNQYKGSLRVDVKKITGCTGFFCSTKASLKGAGGYSYTNRKSALDRARKIYPFE